MKLKDYIKKLQDISKKHPNIEVAYSSDDEGNSYDYVWHNPAVNTVEIDGEDVEVVTINWFFIDIYKNYTSVSIVNKFPRIDLLGLSRSQQTSRTYWCFGCRQL